MPGVVRQGDTNIAGAAATTGASSVFCNGKAVVVSGSSVTPHGSKPTHYGLTTSSSSSVYVEGKPVTLVGDPDTCGHSRVNGSPDVIAG